MTPTKCEHCPLSGSPLDCPAVTRPHPRYCELVDPGHPDHNPKYRDLIAAGGRTTPTLLEKAGNLARAVVSHVADGGRIASPEVQAERKAICFSCSHLDKTRDACSACGCGVIGALSFVGMDMDKKRSWASSRCPLSQPRWEAV